MIPRIVVVSTYNRPAELARLLDAIAPQCDAVFIVDNASTPPVQLSWDHFSLGREDPGAPGTFLRCRVHVIRDEEQPPNLSRLWNVGIDAASEYVRGGDYAGHDLAVLNDDAVPPPGWWDAVSGAMRSMGAAAASNAPFDDLAPGVRRMHVNGFPSIHTRLAGWAMMFRGEWSGARFDERLRWWFGDDEISYRAQHAGGVVHVGGFPVPNTGANSSTTGVLAEQAGRDRATFIEITGRQPW